MTESGAEAPLAAWTDELDALARTPRLLVALDFDGTLAPLVDDPMSARMTPEAAAAVAELLAAPDTAVAFVSGRTLADLQVISEHRDDSVVTLAGSHGAQWWEPGGAADAEAGAHEAAEVALRDELRAAAEEIASAVPGAWVEPKTFGFGVHSRLVEGADAGRVHERIDALMAARAPHWRRREGHSITEYAFRSDGKDTAVARLRATTGATAVLFAGDDRTDEDALRSLDAGDVGIRVGPGETAASVRVGGIAELAALLTRLAHQRVSARQ